MLLHFAYMIILTSFLVSDVMWLRALSILGGGVWILYFSISFQEVNWTGIAWNLLFTLINLRYLFLLILERRPVRLTEEERLIKQRVAPDISARQWLTLVQKSEIIHETDLEAPLISRGDHLDSVYLLMSGALRIESEALSASLPIGCSLGASGYLTGGAHPEDVFLGPKSILLRWSYEQLRDELDRDPQLKAVFQGIFSEEITRQRIPL